MRSVLRPIGVPVALLSLLTETAKQPDNLQKYNLTASGINPSFIGYGARLTNLFVEDKNGMPQDVVLG